MCSCPSEHSAHSAAKTAPATRRGARPSRQAGAVFAQYRLRRTAVARSGAVFAQYPSSRRTAVARRRCCVCTVSFVAAHGRRAKRCCVCTVSVAEHGHCEASAGLHSIRRRGTRPLPLLCLRSIARGARPLRETSAVFAQYPSSVAGHGHCAKAVLCSHSILRGGARSSGEGGAVFAQYPSWRRTAIGRRRCCVCTCFAQFLSIDAKARR